MNGILVDDDEDDPTKYLVYEIIKNIYKCKYLYKKIKQKNENESNFCFKTKLQLNIQERILHNMKIDNI